MREFFSKLFDTSDFPNRWHCGTWSDFHGWLHILSDFAVFAACVAIPVVLLFFLRRRNDTPFRGVFILFAAFMFACGTVHLVEATLFWWPIYRVSAVIKVVTAVMSWAAVIGLVRILPAAISMRIPVELEAELKKRKRAELRLRELLESAPDATVITSENGDVVLVNREAEHLFGYDRNELLGQPIELLFSDEERCGMRKDGSEFPVQIRRGPIQTVDGRLILNEICDDSERVAQEQELQREREKFEVIVNSIPDALMFANTDRELTYCNPAVKRIFGYDAKELIGHSAAILYEDVREYENQGEARFRIDAVDHKEPFETNWVRKDGTVFPAETIGSVVRDSSGEPVGFLGLIRDTTERKEVEKSMRVQEQALLSERKHADEVRSSLGQILEESVDEIYIVDAESMKFVQVNRGGRNNIGYDMNELLELTPMDITDNLPPESIEEFIDRLRNKEVSKLVFEVVHRRKDGTMYDAELHLQPGTYLGKKAYVAFVRDTTERTKIQRALERSEQRFAAFMDNSPFIAWVKDSEGRHEYLSRSAEKEIGISSDEWLGKTDFDFWSHEVAEIHREIDLKVLKSGKPQTFESNYPMPNGKIKDWYVVKFPFSVDEDKALIGGIAVDMSEQRRAESERDRFFETSSDMMCIANFEKYFTRVNQAFTDILGYSKEEMLSRPFTTFVHPNDLGSTDNAVAMLRSGARVVQFENRYRHRDGSYRLISWTTPVPRLDAETFFAVGRDITEQRSLEKNLLNVADNEQRRIAHDLHDGLGQELAGASMMARSLANKLENKSQPDYELATKIADQLGESLKHSRSLARGLRPVEVDSEGLQSALLQLADRISDAFPVECSFCGTDSVQFDDPESATHLFRIAQEAVTNAAKHAEPSTIEIHLGDGEGPLELKVIDDGKGIDKSSDSEEGIGMKSMRYRSNLIGAQFEVQSNRQNGTTVVCRLAPN